MEQNLLATKLYIPPLRPTLVTRPHLVEKIEAGIAAGARLTLGAAPAGFGKTTLLSAWLAATDRKAVWLTLDESDNDLVQFIRYLLVGLGEQGVDAAPVVEPMLQANRVPPQQAAIVFINGILEHDITFLLDDYHLITSPAVHEFVTYLVENQPPGAHLVISTRHDPPLPLPRLRVRGHITEIRQRDLRLSTEEVAQFILNTSRIPITPDTAAALETRTEGWAAGIQLAALALQEQPDQVDEFVANFAGSDRYVMDYLITEVLDHLPAELRTFLEQTAVLDYLSAPLCNALTGRSDSAEILDQLDRANLFIYPLDHHREWYRYHHLFVDMLRLLSGRDTQVELHQRAITWYTAHGDISRAIKHALVAGDLKKAVSLIRSEAGAMLHSGRLSTVSAWLDALPTELIEHDADLLAYRGWILALTGQPTEADASATPQSVPGRVLRVFLMLLLHRDYERTIALAEEALDVLETGYWRVLTLWCLAEAQERTRPLSEAVEAFYAAHDASSGLNNHVFISSVQMSIVMSLNNMGRRSEAYAFCERALASYRDGEYQPLASILLSRMAELHLEADELDRALQNTRDAVHGGQQIGLGVDAVAQGVQARVLAAMGEGEQASALMESIRRAGTSQLGLEDGHWLTTIAAEMRLRQGDITYARHIIDTLGLSTEDDPDYMLLDAHLMFAKVLAAEGKTEEARAWLVRLHAFCTSRELVRYQIHIDVLLAALGEHERLAQALRQAAPERYMRAFVDNLDQIASPLYEHREVAPAFVDDILARAPAIAEQPLIEPLSERELEVLALIVGGLSNREIAEQLVIALGTVKQHINNIYGKLAVSRRTEAVAKAHALHLLE